MKITIVGAGSVGGLIGTKLATAGRAQVNAYARGATLQALREFGWRLEQTDGTLTAPFAQASDRAYPGGSPIGWSISWSMNACQR